MEQLADQALGSAVLNAFTRSSQRCNDALPS